VIVVLITITACVALIVWVTFLLTAYSD